MLAWWVVIFSVWYMADYKHEWWSVALVVPAVAGLMMVRSTAVNQYRNAHKHKVTVYTDDLDNVYVASTSGVDVTYKELWPVEAPE